MDGWDPPASPIATSRLAGPLHATVAIQIPPGIGELQQRFIKVVFEKRQREKDAVCRVPTSPGDDIDDVKFPKTLSVACAQRPPWSRRSCPLQTPPRVRLTTEQNLSHSLQPNALTTVREGDCWIK